MDFVTIGNPGNPADTTGSPNPAGSVGYNYNISKYEVSWDMMNKANGAGNLGVTMWGSGGVDVSAVPNKPAWGISWNTAARFVNYLNTSQGYQAAYNFGTAGYKDNIALWPSGGAGFNINNPFRNTLAHYFLPTVDEWYKAAYFDPNKGGSGGYWNYANQSDSYPVNTASGTAQNSAVVGNYPLTGPADIDAAGGLSAYGTMAQTGNLWEWMETAWDGSNNDPSEVRGLRGGAWNTSGFNDWRMESSFTSSGFPNAESTGSEGTAIGFRVASVPEPSSLSLLAIGGVVLALRRFRLNAKCGSEA